MVRQEQGPVPSRPLQVAGEKKWVRGRVLSLPQAEWKAVTFELLPWRETAVLRPRPAVQRLLDDHVVQTRPPFQKGPGGVVGGQRSPHCGGISHPVPLCCPPSRQSSSARSQLRPPALVLGLPVWGRRSVAQRSLAQRRSEA